MTPIARFTVLGLGAGQVLSAPTTQQDEGHSSVSIVGGMPATLEDFPFIVSVQTGQRHHCGGSLLDANNVITAGHCSVDYIDGELISYRPLDPASTQVRVGSTTWAQGGTVYNVSKITTHPQFVYNDTYISSDVAIWTLATPVPAGTLFASLPAAGSDPVPGQEQVVAGWGKTSDQSTVISPDLLKVAVPVVDREICREGYKDFYLHVKDEEFCAGYQQGGRDSCGGDSGGPIVQAGTNVLNGIVSWGEGCARPDRYGVYVRLGEFKKWVEDTISA